jgi:hypothetical protein
MAVGLLLENRRHDLQPRQHNPLDASTSFTKGPTTMITPEQREQLELMDASLIGTHTYRGQSVSRGELRKLIQILLSEPPTREEVQPCGSGPKCSTKETSTLPSNAAPSGPIPGEPQEPVSPVEWHNPDGLTDEQVEVKLGWRLLMKGERVAPGDEGNAHRKTVKWIPTDNTFAYEDITYRTRRPLPQPTQPEIDAKEELTVASIAAKIDGYQRQGVYWETDKLVQQLLDQETARLKRELKNAYAKKEEYRADFETAASKADQFHKQLIQQTDLINEQRQTISDQRTELASVNQLLARAQEQLKELTDVLGQFVEHCEAVPEDRLIACDEDPHPPSVFSVICDNAKEALFARNSSQAPDSSVAGPTCQSAETHDERREH